MVRIWKRLHLALVVALLASFGGADPSLAEGMVAKVVSSPIFANGTVRDIRSGINIFLQNPQAQGPDFVDPQVLGYGIPPGGRMEVEMVEGFQRDRSIPLAQPSILLVAGTPQQALPGQTVGYTVSEGSNENTFVITPKSPDGIDARNIVSPAPGAAQDPIRQHGVKIVHVGMRMAFVSRGSSGKVAVRIFDGSGRVIHRGSGVIEFLASPRPQIFPTNIPHAKRNHNWQRLSPRETLGRKPGTLPLALLMFERNEKFGNRGIVGAGVVSRQQLAKIQFRIPQVLSRYTAGLIVKDTDGNGVLEPSKDRIIGGVIDNAPEGADGHEVRSPTRDDGTFLSRPTSVYDQRAAKAVGGAIMLVEYTVGDRPGKYRPAFALLADPTDINSGDGSSYSYTVVAE